MAKLVFEVTDEVLAKRIFKIVNEKNISLDTLLYRSIRLYEFMLEAENEGVVLEYKKLDGGNATLK